MTYAKLLDYAAVVLAPLAEQPTATAQARFIQAAVRELRGAVRPEPGTVSRPYGPASDFIDLLAGANLHAPPRVGAGLWRSLMTEWPMAQYAEAMADYLPRSMEDMRVLEVGAGVGNTTALVEGRAFGEYVRADLNTEQQPGLVQWDFNDPPPIGWVGRFDLVFATNAVHCARDVARTMDYLTAVGSRVVLAEGAPYTPAPWALTAPFGLMRGWWDRGGFLPAYRWAGLGGVEVARIYDGEHCLGGLFEWR